MAAIALREDYDATELRALARRSKDARQVRRLLALAAAYDGARRGEAAAVGGMDRQILRNWALRFNAEGPDGLIDRKAPGSKPKLTPEQLCAVVRLVEDGQIPAVHGVVRWRLVDLVGWIYDEYGVSLDPSSLGKILKKLGYARLSARPKHHAQNAAALEAFKANFPPADPGNPDQLPAGTPLKIWFEDEARIGQKNKITRRLGEEPGHLRPRISAPNGPTSSGRSVRRREPPPAW